MERIIEIKHLNKSFGDNEVLKDINFHVNKGEVVSIMAHLAQEIHPAPLYQSIGKAKRGEILYKERTYQIPTMMSMPIELSWVWYFNSSIF